MEFLKKITCEFYGHDFHREYENICCSELTGFPESGTSVAYRLYRNFTYNVCDRCGHKEITHVSEPFKKVGPYIV